MNPSDAADRMRKLAWDTTPTTCEACEIAFYVFVSPEDHKLLRREPNHCPNCGACPKCGLVFFCEHDREKNNAPER